MTFETAKSIIDRDINDENFDEYEFDLFGGEPFLEFDLICRIVDYIVTTYPRKEIVFLATTNGTLVHGKIKEWLKEHSKFFYCALSIDGTKKMHDLNRSGSYDLIDIDFFARTWPTQAMKMTISAQTLPYLAEGVIFMHENHYAFNCNLAFDIDWSDPSNVLVIEAELTKLIDYYLAHPDVKPCDLLSVAIYIVASVDLSSGFRQCGAGIEMSAYDVDGSLYPCQFFMPLSLGEDRSRAAREITFCNEINRTMFEEPCRSCKALHICHTCYGSNYEATGNIFKKDENWCKLQKIIFKANAYFAWKKYQNGVLDCSEEKRPYVLKAIQILLNDF